MIEINYQVLFVCILWYACLEIIQKWCMIMGYFILLTSTVSSGSRNWEKTLLKMYIWDYCDAVLFVYVCVYCPLLALSPVLECVNF